MACRLSAALGQTTGFLLRAAPSNLRLHSVIQRRGERNAAAGATKRIIVDPDTVAGYSFVTWVTFCADQGPVPAGRIFVRSKLWERTIGLYRHRWEGYPFRI